MKNEIDSSQKKLSYPLIFSHAIVKRAEKDGDSKEEVAKAFLSLEGFLSQPDVRTYQNNNTVFVVKTNQNTKTSIVIPFNADTRANYVNNIVNAVRKLEQEGIEKIVFSKIQQDMVDVFSAVKEKIGPNMRIMEVKDSLLCIIDFSAEGSA
tara:strand:- start:2339 stop:2791 length:453 start_codon:yes stop_codon:yes gene_type:complete